LIVFNRALLLAVKQTSNHVAAALAPDQATADENPYTSDRGVERINQSAVELISPLYGELLEAVSQFRLPAPNSTVPLFARREREARWTMMEDFATDFVFAHEYAHVLLRHASADPPQLSEDQGGWGQEYEAD